MSDDSTKATETEPNDPVQSDGAHDEVFADSVAEGDATIDAAIAGSVEEATVDPVSQLKAELADAQKRVLLAQADLENYRKRARRDAEEGVKYASMPLLRDLLPAIDNLQRALEATEAADNENAAEAAGMLEGVKMVSQQLLGVLAQHHCKVIAGDGEFDPNIHEAVLQQPSDEHPAGTIVQVTQSGYQLHDRVVRPAQVIVSKGSAS